MGNEDASADRLGGGFGAGVPPITGSMTRAEMVEAWRERRSARRSAGITGPGGVVDGFALRKWRKAGVFGAEAVARVEDVLRGLLESMDAEDENLRWGADTIRACLDGQPTPQLLPAVKALLEVTDPGRGVARTAAVLSAVHEVGLPWLSLAGERRLAVIMGAVPTADLGSDDLPRPGEDPSGAFALQQALARRSLGELTAHHLGAIVPWAPLGVIDDLIETGVLDRGHKPWTLRVDSAEQSYLLARLAPEKVDAALARSLGWDEPGEREAFLAGEPVQPAPGSLYDLLLRVADGETDVLKELDGLLPRELVLRLRKVRDGAMTGSWDPDIPADRGLWRLMCALWEPRAAVNPARGPFYALVALRHAYDLICQGERKKAQAQVDKLVDHEGASAEHAAEAWNMFAYLALLDDNLDLAYVSLARVARTDRRVEENLALLDRRRGTKRNDRDQPANPYLELGLPHKSEHWKHQWRERRKADRDDLDLAAQANWAMRRIEQAERTEDWSDFFVLPLDPASLRLPTVRPRSLTPQTAAMPRRTTHRTDADLATVRDRAIADLLPTLLTAPRRPDHDHRTTS
ncbi:hypothetical protein QRN89_10080 [Streptomyces chengbuensis]|uniref:hypothetical protein n=1 Tax=Streptomyces chengbuensis TaxID=3053466 RepID=UPI0025B2DC9A|nr:hypothetical protein [Streptomyces sp. HUAS CB01]WJY50139.1 hypothetical protein QRN89_10080 [Streptomyces sp. HUAS CB01]